jgi:bacillopeptidase F (M6 metalloprotease family)
MTAQAANNMSDALDVSKEDADKKYNRNDFVNRSAEDAGQSPWSNVKLVQSRVIQIAMTRQFYHIPISNEYGRSNGTSSERLTSASTSAFSQLNIYQPIVANFPGDTAKLLVSDAGGKVISVINIFITFSSNAFDIYYIYS